MSSVKLRIALEELIATKVVETVLKGSFKITIFDGQEYTIKNASNKTLILKSMFLSDEDKLYIVADRKNIGWIEFYYGNSGFEVIHDYSTNLETMLKPVFDFIAMIDNGGFQISIEPSVKGASWNNR